MEKCERDGSRCCEDSSVGRFVHEVYGVLNLTDRYVANVEIRSPVEMCLKESHSNVKGIVEMMRSVEDLLPNHADYCRQ